MVFASRQNFPFTVPAHYSVNYVQNTSSFQETMSQLSTEMRKALTSAREDLNRVHTGMDGVPDLLNKMILLLRHAPPDLLLMEFPDSFHDIDKLVNNSLLVLRKPGKNFEQVLNLLIEIDYLLNFTSTDEIISLQVYDVKTQWSLLTELIIELAKQAEIASNSFSLQLKWLLAEFVKPNTTFTDSNHDFIISIIMEKVIELDQTSDLLGIVTKTYTDISFQFTDEQISSYAHLLLLTDEVERKQYLNQFRYGLPPVAVQIARRALKQHVEFLERDKNRRAKYQ